MTAAKPRGPRSRARRLPGGVWVDEPFGRGDDDHVARPKVFARRVRPQLVLAPHRSTTAHACTLYPWGVHGSLGHAGVYLGEDQLGGGGAFCFDAFEAYAKFAEGGTATNTNMMVLGQPGMGKSALLKTLLYRSASIYGLDRFIAVVDVKPEYGYLADVLNIPVVKLSPGGSVRVNPLEVRGGSQGRVDRQHQMMRALLQSTLARPLSQDEDGALWRSLVLVGGRDCQATLGDLVGVLRDPPESMALEGRLTNSELRHAIGEITSATEALVERQFRGMFDGESTVSIDPDGPGVIIDISDVMHDENVLPLVMVAATAWLQELLTLPSRAKKIQVLDEAWKMVAFEATARYLQSCWKLGRTYGIANVAVLHKPGDLASQSVDGSAASKISEGLLADTSVRVSFRQTASDLANYGSLLGWNVTERAEIADLRRGESLWKIGEKTVKLAHRLADVGPERVLCDTDQALRNEASVGLGS